MCSKTIKPKKNRPRIRPRISGALAALALLAAFVLVPSGTPAFAYLPPEGLSADMFVFSTGLTPFIPSSRLNSIGMLEVPDRRPALLVSAGAHGLPESPAANSGPIVFFAGPDFSNKGDLSNGKSFSDVRNVAESWRYPGGAANLEVVNEYPAAAAPGGGAAWDGPSGGGGSKRKSWMLSDTETLTGDTSMNYSLPDGPVLGGDRRLYAFNALGRFATRRLAPVVLGAQATGGYSSANASMPLGLLLDASAANLDKRLTLRGSYGLDTAYTGFDQMAPVTHRLGGSLGYRLGPRVDFSGDATYMATECAHSSSSGQEVYEGGLAWRPAADNNVQGRLKLTNSAGGVSYEVFAGFRQKLASAAALSFGTDFRQDWLHLSHERLVLSYLWKWGKYLLSAASTTSFDENQAPEPTMLGQGIMLKVTRTWGVAFGGI